MDNSTGPAAFVSTVAGMVMRISSEGIAGLGDQLGYIAEDLAERAMSARAHAGETYGFVDGSAITAYDSVLGDYELARTAICTDLRRLRDLARSAGACYVAAEDIIDRRHRGLL